MGVQISTSVSIIDSLFGFQAISLTAFDTASVPTIAAGSKVEIAGAFFSFTSDESINATSWSAITTGDTAYITLTPAGTAGTQTVTAAWTSTAPEWSDSKQAYYASAGSNIRVIGGCTKTEATEYSDKFLFNGTLGYADGESTMIDLTIENDLTINNDMTIGGAISPTDSPIFGSNTLNSSYYVLPRGTYNISFAENVLSAFTVLEITDTSNYSIVYKYHNGVALEPYASQGCLVYSDGINVRVRTTMASYTYYYQKY